MRLFEERFAQLNRLGRLDPVMGMGDRFEPLYQAHVARVHHAVRLAGVAARDTPDVVQEVFFTLHRELARGRFETSRPIGPWLYKVSYRKARDFLALARLRHEALMTAEEEERLRQVPSGAPTPEDIAMTTIDVHEHVYTILREIPDEQRLVLVMCYAEGWSMPEIAETLDIPLDTGYSRLRAAEKKFKHVWAAKQSSGAPAILPLALWTMADLLSAAQRSTPALPEGFKEEMWRRIAAHIGVGAGAAAAASAAGLFTGRQVAISAALAALAGAGLHAAVSSSPAAMSKPALAGDAMMKAEAPPLAVSSDAPSASVTASAPSAPLTEIMPSAQATASAAAKPHESSEAKERILLDGARASITSGDLPGALAAVDRHARLFPRGHLAREREELRALISSYRDGGR